MHGPERFLNRELSWLDFTRRVLAQAEEPSRPLLERLKFVAIFSRNLDEFFQVRVAGLQDEVEAGIGAIAPDGRTPQGQLRDIRERVLELTSTAQDLFRGQLLPALAASGIQIVGWDLLSPEEAQKLSARFEAELHPVLVPLAVDPAHPFPYVSDLSLNVGAVLLRPADGTRRFARVKVPPFAARFWRANGERFVPVEQVIRAHLHRLFPEDEVLAAGYFRITRDADLELRERDSGDLMKDVEAGLRRRMRGSDAVRIETSPGLDRSVRDLLMRELQLEPAEAYEWEWLDLGDLMEIVELERPDLKLAPWTPQPVAGLRTDDPDALFARMRRGDVLVHHPYESFEGSVEGFLRAAARDPAVRVLMSTIYRTGGSESGIVHALEGAAARGKQVVVLIELKARFDEAANLERARGLERAGAHVMYGVIGLKTHAKIALVVREEADGLRRYCHIGTGNYNPVTARSYEDLGFLTADPALCRDVAELFGRLTSGSGARHYERLLVAPETLRRGMLERIAREAREPDGRIVAKINNLADAEIIDALYAASRAGAEVDLVVRSICCLRPGLPGLSDRIRVRSVLGRFLEHSRIYRFGSAARGYEYWLGSADLMTRNLDLRVEALVPIDDAGLRSRLEELLALYLHPDLDAWVLDASGAWKRSGGSIDLQRRLCHTALAEIRA
ncbi:MAG TPA: polyphosphate kinase 1 [Myxococcota bacterium]|nr:polyphosphate kinase 1 [Myxococcota bacterium]